jgi:hypothetical protein
MALLGAPTKPRVENGSIRFGDIVVNVVTGRFFDFEEEKSGDVHDLVRLVKPDLQNGAAEVWVKTNVVDAPRAALPDELEAERALIGLLAMQPELMAEVEEEVTAEMFLSEIHGEMFAGIAAAANEDPPRQIGIKGLLTACGGDELMPVFGGRTLLQYIAEVAAGAPIAPDAAHLARSLAIQVRSAANAEVGIDDDYDLDPPPAPWVPRFRGVRFEHIDTPGPEHTYVIDDWLTEGGKMVVGGASLSGKSFLAIHMAMCIATGMPFFGNKVLMPGLVVYQAGEGETGIRKRFRAWRKYFEVATGTQIPLYIIEQKIDIFNPQADTVPFIEEVRGIAGTYDVPLRAIFIDTLAKASIGADENSGRDMGVVLSNVDRISDAFPRANTGLVHHMNAGGTKLRGHTSVYANVDQVIVVTKDEETKIRTATLDKQKDGESGSQIRFELWPVVVGQRQIDGKDITSCVTLPATGAVELRGSGRQGDRRVNLSDRNSIILSSLQKAMAEHGEPLPPVLVGKLPKSIRTVVQYKYWRDAFFAVAGEMSEDVRKKAISRAGEKLLVLRIIGRDGNYVWLTGRAISEVPEPMQGGSGALSELQQDLIDDPLDFSPR